MKLALPAEMYSPDHISMCIRELRRFISQRHDASVAVQMGSASATPTPPPLVSSLLEVNELTDLSTPQLEECMKELETLRLNAPIIHVTLATLPGPKVTNQLITWFRREIHPQALLTIIMNRAIGGGIIVRANSRIYDFSFTSQILRQKDRLTEIFARVR